MNIAPALLEPLWSDIEAWLAAWPRVIGMFAIFPLFRREILPGILRMGLVAALCLPLVPVLKAQPMLFQADALTLALLIVKEVAVGFAFGLPLAMTFWIVEGIGTLLDNQSGSLISSVLNPMSGNDAATLGLFLHQTFMIYFLITGGLSWCLGSLYHSYELWQVQEFWPHLPQTGIDWWLAQFGYYIRTMTVLAAPIVLALFFVELGFGIIGRFAQKMQVFVLAMPIKNVCAIAMLLLYMAVLFSQYDLLMANLKDSFAQTIRALR
ncbi:EscT/YscT/HrcT family type III secretion system export apparatus protein [Oxalobacteraceae bacterium CAVE-383]|nr:EscT/YscT/HrcT family type III secretion system export apparatus protein [Oxalobacteraceae bacterium CAVE-383]